MKKNVKVNQFLKAGQKSLGEQKLEDAMNDFFQAYKLDSENPEVNYFLGITYIKLEEYDLGIDHLENVLASELAYINKVHAQMILGYVYTVREEYEKALPLFKWIVKSGFDSAQAYAAIGFIMDRMGDFKKAVMYLYRAVEINPKNANAHNSLGYIYAEANLNLEEALKECKTAVALDKNNPAYLDSLGWVCYKLGKMSQARSYLNKAHKKAPSNEEINVHLRVVNDHFQ